MDRRKSWESSLVLVAERFNAEHSHWFRREKSALLSFRVPSRAEPLATWLKNREINVLKSL
jgi:hypothetical protein